MSAKGSTKRKPARSTDSALGNGTDECTSDVPSTDVEQLDWVNAECVDGPGLVAWLEEHCELYETTVTGQKKYRHLAAGDHRRLYAWRRGEAASIETADRVLIAHDRYLWELPDELFLPRSLRTKAPRGQRSEAIRLFKAGESVRQIAFKLGRHRDTITNWLRDEGVRPNKGPRRFPTVWRGIDKGGPDECWPWLGHVSANDGPRWHNRSAVRVVYQKEYGELPTTVKLSNICGNKRCCNPAHYEPAQRWDKQR